MFWVNWKRKAKYCSREPQSDYKAALQAEVQYIWNHEGLANRNTVSLTWGDLHHMFWLLA
ncbi:hypothetical protein XA3_01820 [Xylocopilactobacillus apicola]|uniref:Transposase n=1 Tax=Xylocopilactobacillus apicola TaxID=2932184 RepID=A0AAU9CZ89_9LACO|nr:hypothetical protein XA3_01820 [Xylocopilactobacillus apicola]